MSNIRLFPADWPCQFTITAANNDTIFSGLGLGKITDCLSCTVTEERNGSFELKMTYPVTGIRYSQLALRMLIVAPPNPYDPPQAFRIYSISKAYGGKVTIKAQHISYDLSNVMMKKGEIKDDALNPKKIWDYMAGHLTSGFSLNTPRTNFQYTFTSDLTIDDAIDNSEGNKTNNWRLKGSKSVRNVLMGNSEDGFTKLYQVGNNNGEEPEFRYNNFQISIVRNRGTNRGITIRYGKNMKGFTQDESLEKIYTHVYPFYYASSITDYQGGYGDGTQRTYNDWACDLTDWQAWTSDSNYDSANPALIDTGLRDDNGNKFNFKNVLSLDVSSLYKGEYGIDLQAVGTIRRFDGSGWGWAPEANNDGTQDGLSRDGSLWKLKKGKTVHMDIWFSDWNGSQVWRGSDPHFETSHFKFTLTTQSDTGLYLNSFNDVWYNDLDYMVASVELENKGNEAVYFTADPNAGSQFYLEGDGEVDTKNSYYYDLTKPADVSKIAALIKKPAIRYIKENHMARFPVQLKVDLDYAEKINIKSLYDVRLCDVVTVIYPAFNVTTLAKCTKTEYDCLTDKYSKLDFSNSWSGLAFNTAQNIDGTRRSFAGLSYINPALGFARFSGSM